ncbi:MAG TPA: cation-translocating P-type ATPase [Candidatus Paceibacterota bacterium]|nr:cation-translocating P-type ATPase [Candidatus Paceibacterota bacterium]HMO82563.1 cation-translocating P-type ATPase [Candidatus Paceibacterota bacterium]
MTEKHNKKASVCDDCGSGEDTAPATGIQAVLSRTGALKTLTPISGMLLALGFLSSFSLPQEQWSTLFYVLSIVAGSVFVLRSAVNGLIKQRFLNISFLVVIASIGAIYIGEYGEAAAVVFLFSLAEWFESFGVERSRKAVAALIKKSPKVAQLKTGETVPVEEVEIGMVVVVKPGELIPMDGVVVAGGSSVDEAAITGESTPADKVVQSNVFAGTLNIQGYLEIQVEKMSSDSTFARIITLIEEAQASRAPTQTFIDNFARYYTPLVVVVSLLTIVIPVVLLGQPFDEWLYRAITLLVIACPCALVIATPVAIASAIGGASRHGILIKGGVYLEKLSKVKAVAFDKTRTLTYGRHTVTEVLAFGSHTKDEVIADAAGLEAFSSHPLAEVITQYAKDRNITPHNMESFENVAGKGGKAHCLVCNAKSYIGNTKLMKEHAIEDKSFLVEIERLEKLGQTVVMVAEESELIGAIAIADTVREESSSVVMELKKAGVESAMLTGDNTLNATYVAQLVGIDDIRSELLPEDKVKAVKDLQVKYGSVAMVGDGVNDAPSLVTSNVGFAIGAGGTDAAIESSDITLLSGDLTAIPRSIRLAKATMSTIRFNLALAIGVKILFLILVPFGLTNLVFAIAADSGMAIVVILNSLRLFNKQ